VILQTSLIPEIKNKDIKLKHQRIIEKYHLQPEKQIQLARKSHSNQQKDSNTIRKERETDTLCDITDKRPISSILCMSYIICIWWSSAHQRERKVPWKSNTVPKRNHPFITKNWNQPEHSLLNFSPVQRTYCPTTAQTETIHQQIRNVQTDLNTLQEEQILVRKCHARCLCSPNIINIKLRQEKQVKINSNNITLSSAKKRTMSKEIQNRIQNKSGYNSKFNLKPSLSI